MKKIIFLALFFLFSLPLFSEINYIAFNPKKYESIIGSHQGKGLSLLANRNTDDDYSLYYTLNPLNQAYLGETSIFVSKEIDVNSVKKIAFKLNFKTSEASTAQWICEIRKNSGEWVELLSFSKLDSGEMRVVDKKLGTEKFFTSWHSEDITVEAEPWNYINNKKISLRISSKNADKTAFLDYVEATVFYEDSKPKPKASWTFIVYVSADNDLEEGVINDLETEMGYSNRDINIVTMVDRHPKFIQARGNWTNTLLFRPAYGFIADRNSALEDWGEMNTGDPKTLKRFIDWAMKNYPAEKYALQFWGHGSTWRQRETMYDDTNFDALHPHEMVEVLKNYKPFEYIGFDSCMMGNIEMQTILKPFAKYYVASQEIVEMGGFEFESVFPMVQQNPAISGKEIAIAFGKSMKDYTTSTVDLGAPHDKVIKAVDDWSKLLVANFNKYRKNYEAAYKRVGHIEQFSTKDLRDVAREIKKSVPDEEIKGKSQALIDAIEDGFVIYTWKKNDGDEKEEYKGKMTGGITIFWPETPRELRGIFPPYDDFNYYKKTHPFAKLTHWDEFIELYATRLPEVPPDKEERAKIFKVTQTELEELSNIH